MISRLRRWVNPCDTESVLPYKGQGILFFVRRFSRDLALPSIQAGADDAAIAKS
jgi:hypothetical protein